MYIRSNFNSTKWPIYIKIIISESVKRNAFFLGRTQIKFRDHCFNMEFLKAPAGTPKSKLEANTIPTAGAPSPTSRSSVRCLGNNVTEVLVVPQTAKTPSHRLWLFGLPKSLASPSFVFYPIFPQPHNLFIQNVELMFDWNETSRKLKEKIATEKKNILPWGN